MAAVLAVMLVPAAQATIPPPTSGDTLQVTRGKRVSRLFIRIPASQRYLTLQNGIPGLTAGTIWVNGRTVFRGWLSDGEVVRRDVGGLMRPGRMNTVRVTGMGARGVTATFTISDTPD
jgi:hypothetical protein